MSRWLERRNRGDDAGFTLLEVMAAIAVFAIVAAGSLPLLIGAARASVNGKMQSQAKQLVQAQMDAMRNLPFHVDATKGQFIDVLDKYYPNNASAAAAVSGMTWLTATTGYVSASRVTSSDRITGEPTGDFYRSVLTQSGSSLFPGDSQFARYKVIVDTQFLGSSGNPVTPPTGYNSATSPADSPPAAMLGVTVTTAWTQGAAPKSFTSATRISNARPVYIISEHGRATAVSIQSKLASNGGATLSLVSGDVTADGGSATGTTATVNALAMDSLIGGSVEAASQALTLTAPPNATANAAIDAGPHYLSTGDCTYVCFGQTSTSGGFVKVDNGLPLVGDPSSTTVAADVLGTGNGTYRGFSYSNEPSNSALHYDTTAPLVFLRDTGGSAPLAHSQARVKTTSGSPHSANVTVRSNAAVLDLFPTSFSGGRGVLEATLDSASLSCDVTTSSSGSSVTTATGSWSASVRYRNGSTGNYDLLGGAALANGSGPNLAGLNLSSYYVGTDSDGVAHYLSEYISSMTGLTTMPAPSIGTASIQATIPSIVSITSTSTRASDPTSQINVQMGTMSCSAGDQR